MECSKNDLKKYLNKRYEEIESNAKKWGIDGIILIYTGHGGNTASLKKCGLLFSKEKPVMRNQCQ